MRRHRKPFAKQISRNPDGSVVYECWLASRGCYHVTTYPGTSRVLVQTGARWLLVSDSVKEKLMPMIRQALAND